MLDAAQVVGLNCLRLLNDMTAGKQMKFGLMDKYLTEGLLSHFAAMGWLYLCIM